MKALIVIIACTLGVLFSVNMNSIEIGNLQVIEAAPCEKDKCLDLLCTIATQDWKCSIGPGSCTTSICT